MFVVILSYTLSDNIGEIKNIYLYYILSLGKCYDKKKNAVIIFRANILWAFIIPEIYINLHQFCQFILQYLQSCNKLQ